MIEQPLQEMTVNAVVARYPETVRTFATFGIDTRAQGRKGR